MPWPRGKAKGKHPIRSNPLHCKQKFRLVWTWQLQSLRWTWDKYCVKYKYIYIYIQISSKNSRLLPISGPRGIDHHSCYICRDLSWELEALDNSNMSFWGIAFRTLQKKVSLTISANLGGKTKLGQHLCAVLSAMYVESPGPSTLVELRVTMAFADLACWKPCNVSRCHQVNMKNVCKCPPTSRSQS